MAYMLRKRILTASDLPDDTTWKEDAPDVGMVTAFEFRIRAVREETRASNVAQPTIIGCISRVELIAESTKKVLSVTGRQLDFLNYLDFKRPNPRRHREMDECENVSVLYLMGGRSLYDTEYGWDMSKLKNAFFNYTYDLQESVAEYFEADLHSIDVYQWAWMGPGAPTFKGYFKNRQVLSYDTTGTGTLKTLKITPGLPLRRVIIQRLEPNKSFAGTLTRVELEVNNGEYSPVIITTPMDWMMQQVSDYGLLNRVAGKFYCKDTDGLVNLPDDFAYYDNIQVVAHNTAAPDAARVYSDITPPARVGLEVAGEGNWDAWGWGYQGCLNIGFDHLPDLSDVLLTRGMGALRLILTEKVTGQTVAVVLQEVELY